MTEFLELIGHNAGSLDTLLPCFLPLFVLLSVPASFSESSDDTDTAPQETPDVDSIPAMTYRREFAEQSRMLYCSNYTEEYFGYSPNELTSEPRMPFYRLIYPGDRNRVRQQIKQSVENDEVFQIEYRMLTRNKK
ncbi:MAG: PAS domain-containing protein, partial [bacterium]